MIAGVLSTDFLMFRWKARVSLPLNGFVNTCFDDLYCQGINHKVHEQLTADTVAALVIANFILSKATWRGVHAYDCSPTFSTNYIKLAVILFFWLHFLLRVSSRARFSWIATEDDYVRRVCLELTNPRELLVRWSHCFASVLRKYVTPFLHVSTIPAFRKSRIKCVQVKSL